MSRLRTAQYQRSQAEEPNRMSSDGEELQPTARREMADWSNMSDEQVFRSQLRKRVFSAILALAGDLPGAGDAARHSGHVDRGSERDAPREGSDAQVAAAPRPIDSAEAARRLRRRSHAAPGGRLMRSDRDCHVALTERSEQSTAARAPARQTPLSSRQSSIALSSATRSCGVQVGQFDPDDAAAAPSRDRQRRASRATAARVVWGDEGSHDSARSSEDRLRPPSTPLRPAHMVQAARAARPWPRGDVAPARPARAWPRTHRW